MQPFLDEYLISNTTFFLPTSKQLELRLARLPLDDHEKPRL
jgi:hypothetical protein